MLINAMEVSGVEGSYRTTCEKTMSVMRESRDSLVAMLEAFVHDPLISWKKHTETTPVGNNDTNEASEAIMVAPNAPRETTSTLSISTRRPPAASLQIIHDIQSMAAEQRSQMEHISRSVHPSAAHLSIRQRELHSILERGALHEDVLNKKAVKIVRRVEDKLEGTDFPDVQSEILDVPDQVQRLIVQATSVENLCQMFHGWCPFW